LITGCFLNNQSTLIDTCCWDLFKHSARLILGTSLVPKPYLMSLPGWSWYAYPHTRQVGSFLQLLTPGAGLICQTRTGRYPMWTNREIPRKRKWKYKIDSLWALRICILIGDFARIGLILKRLQQPTCDVALTPIYRSSLFRLVGLLRAVRTLTSN